MFMLINTLHKIACDSDIEYFTTTAHDVNIVVLVLHGGLPSHVISRRVGKESGEKKLWSYPILRRFASLRMTFWWRAQNDRLGEVQNDSVGGAHWADKILRSE